MKSKKKFKEEKASMAVYVSVVLISFLFILSTLYFSSTSVRKIQLKTIMSIKESYEQDTKDIEKIYQNQLKKLINIIE